MKENQKDQQRSQSKGDREQDQPSQWKPSSGQQEEDTTGTQRKPKPEGTKNREGENTYRKSSETRRERRQRVGSL